MSPLQLAWLNLTHHRARFVISLAGVTFAVVLVFMQLGFLGAVEETATLIYDHLEFDLILVSAGYVNMNLPGTIPRARLMQTRTAGEVTAVLPVSLGGGLWRDPRTAAAPDMEPRRWRILILAVPPADLRRVIRRGMEPLMFRNVQEIADAQVVLTRPDTFYIDRTSRPEFGTPEQRRPGSIAELNERRVQLAGDFEIGTGFGYNGLLLGSEETLRRVTGWPADRVSFGLVQLARGTDPTKARELLLRVLPSDVRILTRAEIAKLDREFWVSRTAVGQIFTFGVAVSLLVGGFFVYQMMSGDIRNHLAEYATIKAMGYRRWFLSGIVTGQAVLLALVGYVPGLIASLGLYQLTAQATHLPLEMTAMRLASVLGLTVGMCLLSGLLAVRIVHSSNPADLF
jgi:putative ABC transport system permease protein